VRGVVTSMLGMISAGADSRRSSQPITSSSHFATGCVMVQAGAGIEPALLGQFPLLEEALAALGITVWPMVEFEADDALAAGR